MATFYRMGFKVQEHYSEGPSFKESVVNCHQLGVRELQPRRDQTISNFEFKLKREKKIESDRTRMNQSSLLAKLSRTWLSLVQLTLA